MTTDTLKSFLYKWINQIINTEPATNPPIEIIEAYDEGTIPSDKYISINPQGNWRKIGSSSSTGETNATGEINRINDYEIMVELREIHGNGDLLSAVIDSIERQDIKDLFGENNLTYYEEGLITSVPTLEQSKWRHESFVELRLGTAKEIVDNTNYISDVDASGTIPAQGRSGDHSINI